MTTAEGPRRKVLIFHIGDHKTGSTSIQLAFAKGLVTVSDHTIFYPAKLAMNVLEMRCKAYGAASTPEAKEKAAIPLRKLADRIRKANADFTVISAEALENVPPDLFHDIVNDIFADTAEEIRIICYVRPHAPRILSSFAERTKVGMPRVLTATLERFARREERQKEFTYLPRFTAWRNHFGTNFILRPMIRNQLIQKDVVSDFIHYAFGGLPFTIAGDRPANESLDLEDLMRLKVVQMNLQVSRELRLRIGWEFARLSALLPPPPQRTKLQLHKSLAKKIRRIYLEDARNMDQAFFDGEPLLETELNTAVDKAIAKAQSTDPADHFSASELHSLTLLSKMLVGMLEEPTVNWSAFFHAKRVRDVQPVEPDATTTA